jgi:outer membrane receptor protein involved in Fe transport
MIDNLVITKTATPDLTGEFAGGVIQITTKNIPDKNFQSVSYGNGYNSLATGKTQRYYEGGKTDWLGIDDGTRALPSSIPSAKVFKTLDRRARIPFAKAMNSDWELKNKNFSPNVSFQYSLGQRYDIGEKTLGILFSTSYSKSNSFDQTLRNTYETQGVISNINDDKTYREQVLLGALANFTLKINPNNSVSFKNIYSINSDDRVVERDSQANYTNPEPDILYSSVRWFTSNKIYIGQLVGEHYLPNSKLKINWLGSYSDVYRSIPNLRRNIYKYDTFNKMWEARISDNTGGTDQGGGIFYSNNSETNKNAKIDLSKKLGNSSNHEIKTGLFYQNRNRNFSARQFHYTPFIEGNINFDTNIQRFPTKEEGDKTIFGPQNIGEISSTAGTVGGFTLLDYSTKSDIYSASSELKAGYLMSDNKLKNFRLVWGLRSEEYRQLLDSDSDDKGPVKLDTKQIDFLPSVNLIYSLDTKRNLRFSYSKTLNRPEFRELAPFLFYDFTTRLSTQGDPKLKIASIQNYDFRFETYPGKNQLFSVSVFYKQFNNPIEIQAQAGTTTVLYQNAGAAFNYGVEMEFRTQLSSLFHFEGSKLLDNLTVFSNISSISSEVDVTNIVASSNLEKKRQLQGQSPYVLNAGIQYSDDNGFNVAANLNRVGNRIAVGGNSEAEPTLWEKSRTFLDCQVSKTFLDKKMELKLNVQNILAQDQIFYNNNDAIPFDPATDGDKDQASLFKLPKSISKGIKNTINRSFGNRKNWYNSQTDDLVWKIKTATTFSFSLSYNF